MSDSDTTTGIDWRHVASTALGVLAGIVAAAGTLAVAVAGFTLSYDAIRKVGIASGIRDDWAWLLPVSIDGAMSVATVTAVVLRWMGRSGKQLWYPWAVVISGALISIACNGIHAQMRERIELPDSVAIAVSAIPALMLALSVHLLVVLVVDTAQALRQRADMAERLAALETERSALETEAARLTAQRDALRAERDELTSAQIGGAERLDTALMDVEEHRLQAERLAEQLKAEQVERAGAEDRAKRAEEAARQARAEAERLHAELAERPIGQSERSAAPKRAALRAVEEEPSQTALADAETLREKWGEGLPERGAHALVQSECGWGGQKATNAIKAYRWLRRSGEERSAS